MYSSLFVCALVGLFFGELQAFQGHRGFLSPKNLVKLQKPVSNYEIMPRATRPTILNAIVDDSDIESGPALSAGKRAVVEEYVHKMHGKRAIQRILIANNGMAATKSILSMKQWAYNTLGDENALEFVAMATRDDLNANAEFVRLADTFVEVPSGSNKNNYANVDLIVNIAVQEKVDAVWPGWGHASENPKLPSILKSKGIQFIGPTASVMAALGDKISANILAQSAKVPSIPWSGDGIESALNEDGVIPPEVFKQACVTNVDEAATMAQKIGYPVMIKASEGGGGKGIRLAKNAEELRTNFIQVQNEVPGSPIFMMQLCTEARHLEVQIVGDEYGNAVALSGRDCSTQRRFQKIFEEGPPIVAPPEVFRQMERSAQRLTQSIGYIGAGTVEYLYNAKTQKYYFLELNPRLQVEHPVTEGITGINLPSVQLQVAMGIPLDRIPDVRNFYGRDSTKGYDKIDFMKEDYEYPKNHVIAARITAENPEEGFKPTSGKIERVKFQSSKNVWGYFSVGANGGIHEFADSQFGHLFASGKTREEARKALVLALKGIDVRGDIRTTVEYLIKLLETKEFKANEIDTSWLDGIIREKSVAVSIDPQLVVLSAAIFKAHSALQTQLQDFEAHLLKGQTSLQQLSSLLSFPFEITYDNMKYSFNVKILGLNNYLLQINDQVIEIKLREQPDKSLLCNINGQENLQLFGQEEALGLRMKIDGQTVMIPKVYNPSELRSDVTGKIVRYLQQDREFVAKDQPYVEVEAMKMIMALKATESGTIRQHLSPGSIISAGDLIATLALQDPNKSKQILPFKGRLQFVPPVVADAIAESSDASVVDDIAQRLSLALQGFPQDAEALVTKFFKQATQEQCEAFLVKELTTFYNLEKAFDGQEESVVVGTLTKNNKENLAVILPQLIAHKQQKQRVQIILNLLRQLEFLPERFAGSFILQLKALQASPQGEQLVAALNSVSSLKDPVYGALALKAKQILDVIAVPPFENRLSALKQELLSMKTDLETLSKQPNIAVSVDLLVVLMADENEAVRKAAMEVFIRRVYRAHDIQSLSISEDKETQAMAVNWVFRNDGTTGKARAGHMVLFPSYTSGEAIQQALNNAKEFYASVNSAANVLHVGFFSAPGVQSSDQLATLLAKDLTPFHNQLKALDIRSVNFLSATTASFSETAQKRVNYFNFPSDVQYNEDKISRDMRPSLPALLELNRLVKNHDITRLPSVNRNTFLFYGKEKAPAVGRKKDASGEVLFLRSISLSEDSVSGDGAERIILMALDELERAMLDPRVSDTCSSRLYVNILPKINVPLGECVERFKKIMDHLVAKYATKLLKLRVDEIEVKIRVKEDGEEGEKYAPIRLIASSSTGGWLTREAYREYLDPVTGQTTQYCTLSDGNKICVLDPYPTSNILQKKRSSARRVGSTYATDFLGLIEVALINTWKSYLDNLASTKKVSKDAIEVPSNVLTFEELVLQNNEIVKVKRFPGSNTIGMLAWHTVLKTPQYPEGREVVIIANDVTVQSGSFGVQEDEFFFKVSEYARTRGLPKVFLSCNSGARIGLVEELKPKFKIAWKDDSNVGLGFDYLYLSAEDYQALPPNTVAAQEIVHPATGEIRYKLDAIIGQIHGIGVENLKGSGLIAGETARAYDEGFTLSYVTGRSVGIGAYLNRLGQRVIQMNQGPMILTGYSALNKLLGKEVYTSQDQLGGPQIMYPNGVTHQVVDNDREGMQAVVDWLSFTPKDFFSVAPKLPYGEIIDSPDRPIDFVPTKTPYDPRHMLAGQTLPDGSHLSGFFDKGSFKEYLGGWGKSVVTGRARLGGINVGVIAVETRLTEQRIPADPANPESREAILPQAGQVWYPDSAFKTAQAIQDFNKGENLPLIIFANWRGFSGGTRDMYSEILKYGAMIVDSLRNYKHPVFVYIPPCGELRGGAWVVIDPSINPEKMEMFADQEARGGILEPPGICEVKYRQPDQVVTMHRLDPQLQELDEQLSTAFSTEEKERIQQEIKAREKALMPLYLQIAHEFADLHDRAGRMKAKGCISEILSWKSARSFFYWRILKRQSEEKIVAELVDASHNTLSAKEAKAKLYEIIPKDSLPSDKEVVSWLQSNPTQLQSLVNRVKVAASTQAVTKILQGLDEKERQEILKSI